MKNKIDFEKNYSKIVWICFYGMTIFKIIPPVRLDFSANIPCLFGKGIIMPFGKVTCS